MPSSLPSRRKVSSATVRKQRAAKAKTPLKAADKAKAPALDLEVVDPWSVGVDPDQIRGYENAMQGLVRNGTIPGCASVVFRRSKVVQMGTWGYADIERKIPYGYDSMCRLVCMTKSYIATCFMSLVDDGLVSLEDPLSKFIPAFANVQVLLEGGVHQKLKRPILMKHLIAHTSGISYAPDIGEEATGETMEGYSRIRTAVLKGQISSLKAFVERLAHIPLVCHPGENYNYGFSMDVLGRIIEMIMGRDLSICLQVRVFDPLGMHNTKWYVRDDDLDKLAACYAKQDTWKKMYGDVKGVKKIAPRKELIRVDGSTPEESGYRYGQHCKVKLGGGFLTYTQGGMVSTVADTVKFMQMLLRHGVTESGQRILARKTLKMMEKNTLKEKWGAGKACFLGNVGVFREGGPEIGMGGASCTYWSLDRKDDVACIWFSQHLDMPEFPDIKGVDWRKADLWQVMYNAVRSKGAKAKARAAQKNKLAPKRRMPSKGKATSSSSKGSVSSSVTSSSKRKASVSGSVAKRARQDKK